MCAYSDGRGVKVGSLVSAYSDGRGVKVGVLCVPIVMVEE